jgi:hypothetical protein
LAPKLAKPLGTDPPPLILDPVYPIEIESRVVLFKDVYLLKYSYSEIRFRRVNKSFIIPGSNKLVTMPISHFHPSLLFVGKGSNNLTEWSTTIVLPGKASILFSNLGLGWK